MAGPQEHLLAIWTPPVQAKPRLVVLLLNAGVIHRVGPHRLHVKLARALAEYGLGCVRLDLSGVGDSRAPRDAADFRTQAGNDIHAVMDTVSARFGCADFALVGLCSGAAHAQAAAVKDPRVKAVFLIDGYMYPSWRGRLHFARRMAQAYGWWEAGTRISRGLWAAFRHRLAGPAPSVDATPEPQRDPADFSRDMQALTARGVHVSLMFTGSVLEVFAYPHQLRDQFAGAAWLEKVRYVFEPDVDHTLTLQASQQLLRQRLEEWLSRAGGLSTPPKGRASPLPP